MSADSELEHFEFLAEDEEDPRRAFIDSLSDALAKRGLIVAYNAGFESQRLRDLASWMPEYAGTIAKIQAHVGPLAVREETRVSPTVSRVIFFESHSSGTGAGV